METCSVYAWCTIPGLHYDHAGAEIAVPPQPGEGAYLSAHLLHLDGSRPFIGLEGFDLTADQARTEAARIRAFAAHLEDLASLLDAHPVSA